MNKTLRQLKLYKSNWMRKMNNSNGFLILMKRLLRDLRITSQEACLIPKGDWEIWSIDRKVTRLRKMRMKRVESWMKMKNRFTRNRYRICFCRSIAWVNISNYKTWIAQNQIRALSKWITQQVMMSRQEMTSHTLHHKIFLRNYLMSILKRIVKVKQQQRWINRNRNLHLQKL